MARAERSADEFDRIADNLDSLAKITRQIAKMIRDADMPSVLVHGVEVHSRLLPKFETWAEKARFDATLQTESYKRAKRDAANAPRSRRKAASK